MASYSISDTGGTSVRLKFSCATAKQASTVSACRVNSISAANSSLFFIQAILRTTPSSAVGEMPITPMGLRLNLTKLWIALCRDKFYDIDTAAHRLTVRLGKGQRDRLVPLTETAAHWLTRYLTVARPELAAGKLWGKGRRVRPLCGCAPGQHRLLGTQREAASFRGLAKDGRSPRVSVEDLLSVDTGKTAARKATKSNSKPAGKVREVFDRVSKLPRRQQEAHR